MALCHGSGSRCGYFWAVGLRQLCTIPSGIDRGGGEFYKCGKMMSPLELTVGFIE